MLMLLVNDAYHAIDGGRCLCGLEVPPLALSLCTETLDMRVGDKWCERCAMKATTAMTEEAFS